MPAPLRRGCLLGLALLLGAAGVGRAAPWAPPGWVVAREEPAPGPTNPAAAAVGWGIRLYQATVSRVDGDRCPSHPTCSAYAAQALREHGPLVGLLLTFGRLVSEADEAGFAPRIWVDGRWKVHDPVDQGLAFWRGRLAP